MKEIKLLSGNASKPLKEEIAKVLEISPSVLEVSRFQDGEIRIQILENIRGDDVFIIQSTHPPAENLMELLLLIDAAKRASAARITAVIPYFGYARQDRKDQPRVPISAKLVANLLERAGADRILTVDLHADQIQGFFDIPVDNLYATPVFKNYFNELNPREYVIVSPDVGGTKRAMVAAHKLGNLPLALVDKRRPALNSAEIIHIVGDVKGKKLLIIDDIIDTGNTLAEASKALREHGASEILVAATHGLFSGDARRKLEAAPVKEIVVTNTLPVPAQKRPHNMKILTIAPLLADAIVRIHEEKSVSSLFI